jgi:hypothetical protein
MYIFKKKKTTTTTRLQAAEHSIYGLEGFQFEKKKKYRHD